MELREFVNDLRSQGVNLSIVNEELKVAFPKGKSSPELLQHLRSNKEEILAQLRMEEGNGLDEIFAIEEQEHYPVSYAQNRMWVLDQYEENQYVYNVPQAFAVKGKLDIDSFSQAYLEVIDRHEILRTTFAKVNGEVRQKVDPLNDERFKMGYLDLRAETNGEELAHQIILKEKKTFFSLINGPLVKSKLIHINEEEFILLLTMHHSVTDGWSFQTFYKDLLTAYSAFAKNEKPAFADISIQYKDFTTWQRKNIEGAQGKEAKEYWLSKLGGELPVLSLPTDRKRPNVFSFKGAQQRFKVSKELTNKALQLSKKAGVTNFMFLLSTLKVLLYKYTKQGDVVVGTPVAGRGKLELENQIGLYMNTLALRSQLNENDTFLEALEKVSQTAFEGFKYQEYPFDHLVDDLSLKRDVSRSPLFDVMITVAENYNINKASEKGGLSIEKITGIQTVAEFDLTVSYTVMEDGLQASFIYNTDLFDDWRIEQMFRHYETLLDSIIENPEASLKELAIVSENESDKILNSFNTELDLSRIQEESYLGCFYNQVDKNPDSIAVTCDGKELSYLELDQASSKIANLLVEKGIQKDDLVAIFSNRSIEMLTYILAVIKSGGAFVFFNPKFPLKRLLLLAQETQTKMMLTQSSVSDDWTSMIDSFQKESSVRTVVFADSFEGETSLKNDTKEVNPTSEEFSVVTRNEWDSCSAERPNVKLDLDSLSYLFFTSGSTGKPKGALIENQGMFNHVLALIDAFNIDENSVIAQTAPQSFDISVWQFITGIAAGSRTVIYKESVIHNPLSFLEEVNKDGVTILQLVPSYIVTLLDEVKSNSEENYFEQLQFLSLTGEATKATLLNEWFELFPEISVVNAYGPAEASDDVTLNIITKENFKQDSVSIGTPIINTRIYILDQDLNLCPIGHPGEIYVAGIPVGRGYLNDAEKTAQSFLTDPFLGEDVRMYKTGDLGVWNVDGSINFIGRKDHQVKIRGQRIELGEIEAFLNKQKGVKEAVVVDTLDADGNKCLVGFVTEVDQGSLSLDIVTKGLEKDIPSFMIPQKIQCVAQLPTTANGKVDRATLKIMADFSTDEKQEAFAQPTNDVETKLLEIWKEVLNTESISTDKNFFDAGGHSLKVIVMISKIYKDLSVKLELKDVFANPTIQALATLVGGKTESVFEGIPKLPVQEYYDVSFAQRRLWVVDQMLEDNRAFNIPSAYIFKGKLDVDAFCDAFQTLIDRHESFRTVFLSVDGVPKQRIIPTDDFEFEIDVQDFSGFEFKEEKTSDAVERLSWDNFDLEKGPLLRAALIKQAEDHYVFTYSVHHIISDGWSTDIIKREVIHLYNDYINDRKNTLKPLRIQYKDYAAWSNDVIDNKGSESHRAYWLNQFEELPAPLSLPTENLRPAVKTYNGSNTGIVIGESVTNKLRALAKRNETTLFSVLVSAVNGLFYRYTGQKDITLGITAAERHHSDLNDLIGFFVNMLPVRNRFSETDSFEELLQNVKDNMLGALNHQAYPFDKLVDELDLERDTGRSPLFDVVMTMRNTGFIRDDKDELDGLEIDSFGAETNVIKYDLAFFFNEAEDSLGIQLYYNTDIYPAYRIQRMLEHLNVFLEEAVAEPLMPLNSIKYLAKEEETFLKKGLNEFKNWEEFPALIHEIVENIAETYPDEIAVSYKDKDLSYGELNKESNRLAHYFREHYKVKANDIIAVLLEPSDKLIITLLAILKSGAGWLPIGLKFPTQRKEFVMSDAGVSLLVTSEDLKEDLENYQGEIFIPDTQWNNLSTNTDNLVNVNTTEDTAYVIYTSGTTGKPKGVVVPHKSLVAYIDGYKDAFNTGIEDSTLMVASLAFDGGYTNLWGALGTGACVVIPPYAKYVDRDVWMDLIRDKEITFFKFTPSHLNLIVDHEDFVEEAKQLKVQTFILGGEAINVNDVERLFNAIPDVTVYNHYGPTEATVGCTFKKITLENFEFFRQNPVIGSPLAENKIYILDESNKLVPQGIIGEVCVTGRGVANGYLNRPELTDERFIDNPFDTTTKMYKTGDFAYLTQQHEIRYLGRKDNQVKVRGYRIEKAEIKHVLDKFAGISGSIVVIRKDAHEQNILVCYYTATEEFEESELRSFLAKSLPSYMVPSYLVEVEAFKLNNSGKIDTKQLPDPESLGNDEIELPINFLEEKLLEVWSEVLKKDTLGRNSNFFSVGGDSIKAIQVASRISKHGYKVSVKDIFESPVLADLAKTVKNIDRIAFQGEVKGEVPLTPIIHRFFENETTDYDHYNQAVILGTDGEFDSDAVEAAIKKLHKHHDMLRCIANKDENSNWQLSIMEDNGVISFEKVDLRQESDELEVLKNIASEWQRDIRISNGPLLRSGLFKLKGGDRLLFCIHHLVVDGVSWRILLEDFKTLYQQITSNQKVELPLKTDSFKLWAEQLKEYPVSAKFKEEIAYWDDIVDFPVNPLQKDYEDNSNYQKNRKNLSFSLSKNSTYDLLNQMYRVFKLEVNDVLLTAFALSIQEIFGEDACLIDLEGHGREEIASDIDVTRTVGWFTSVFPVLLDVSSMKMSDQIIAVKESLHKVPNRGIGYGIFKYLSTEETRSRYSKLKPQVSFNYLGQFGGGSEKEDIFISDEDFGKTSTENWVSPYLIDVVGFVGSNKLTISLEYNEKHFKENTINQLKDAFHENLERVIAYCKSEKDTYLTPSDLTYTGLSIPALQQLTQKYQLEDVYKLSPLQTGIFFLSNDVEGDDPYFRQISYNLKGNFSYKQLSKSIKLLFKRHEALRTVFVDNAADIPLQVVLKKPEPEILYKDLREVDAASRDTIINDYKIEDTKRSFDFQNDLSLRVAVFQSGDNDFELVWSYHHMIMDGWCTGLLTTEFFEIYKFYKQNLVPRLPEVQPYRNYIKWLDNTNVDSLDFWANYLNGYEDLASLPKSSDLVEGDYIAKEDTYALDPKVYEKLNKLATKKGITLNSVIQTLWGIILSKYNNTNDVVFGTIVSGRPSEIEGIESMIGLFINTIPVRVNYEEKETLTDLFKKVQKDIVSGTPYHYNQLAEIQAKTDLGSALLDHVIVFENYPLEDSINDIAEGESKDSLNFNIDDYQDEDRSHYDFSIKVVPGSTLKISFCYNNQVYSDDQIEQLKNQFDVLINKVVNERNIVVADIDILTETERKTLTAFNDTDLPYVEDKTVNELFERMVADAPDNTALVCPNNTLTYQMLNERSNRLARYLREECNVKNKDIVGVMCDRNEYLLITTLAVLKAGGAYMPIDTNYPENRINHMVSDSNVQLVLTDQVFEVLGDIRQIVAPEIEDTLVETDGSNLVTTSNIDDIAFVVYTSGSTGRPNGVMVSHRGTSNISTYQKHNFGINAESRILQFAPSSFDSFLWEWIMALTAGGSLVIPAKAVIDDPEKFVEFVNEHEITCMTLPPAYLKILNLDDIQNVEILITAGEEANKEDAIHLSEKMQYWNGYGPSECTVCVSTYQVSENDRSRRSIPIGKPMTNTKTFILSKNLQELPLGAVGEICVSSPGLAIGYINNQELTDQKFVTFNGQRVYRTGDLGRWLPDGNLEFLGRIDNQIKIRGNRVEVGEITHVLKQFEGISNAKVLVNGEKLAKKLVAFYTGTGDDLLDKAALQEYLFDKLPSYMVPSIYRQVDGFPVTPNGKIDKKALLAMLSEEDLNETIVEAQTENERKVIEVWKQVLNLKEVSANDNFLMIGGDSIKAMQVASRLNRSGFATTAKQVLEYPVLSDFARYLKVSERVFDQSKVEGTVPLIPIQEWFFNDETDCHHFNQSMMLYADTSLDRKVIKQVFEKIVEHHDALRMTFQKKGSKWTQYNVGDDFKPYWNEVDLRKEASPEASLIDQVKGLQESFDLEKGPLFKPTLFALPTGDYVFIPAHHLVMDAVSWTIILEDINYLYENMLKGKEVTLPLKTSSYKNWADALTEYANSDTLLKEKKYWSEVEQENVAELVKADDSSLADFNMSNFAFDNDKTKSLLTEVHHAFNTNVPDLLLAALAKSMQEVFDVDSLALSMEGHGREAFRDDLDISRTVGWFTSMYPLVIHAKQDFEGLIVDTKERIRKIPNNGMGYGVLKYLTNDKYKNDLSFKLKPQISFNYLGHFNSKSEKEKEVLEVRNDLLKNDFSENRSFDYVLMISAFISNDQLTMNIGYNQKYMDKAQIDLLSKRYQTVLSDLIDFCTNRDKELITPSDLTLKGLSLDDISKLLIP